MMALRKYAAKKKLTKSLIRRLLDKANLTEAQKMEFHRYAMPSFTGTAMWGLTGAALSPKEHRKKALLSGMALGAVRPVLWKAIAKGYAKAVKRPFGELIK